MGWGGVRAGESRRAGGWVGGWLDGCGCGWVGGWGGGVGIPLTSRLACETWERHNVTI